VHPGRYAALIADKYNWGYSESNFVTLVMSLVSLIAIVVANSSALLDYSAG